MKKRRCAAAASVTFALAIARLSSQTPPQKPSFDVVSIKPSPPLGNGPIRIGGGTQGDRFTMNSATLRMLLQTAYQSAGSTPLTGRLEIIGGPSWMDSDRYDVQAKADCSGGKIPRETAATHGAVPAGGSFPTEGALGNARTSDLQPGGDEGRSEDQAVRQSDRSYSWCSSAGSMRASDGKPTAAVTGGAWQSLRAWDSASSRGHDDDDGAERYDGAGDGDSSCDRGRHASTAVRTQGRGQDGSRRPVRFRDDVQSGGSRLAVRAGISSTSTAPARRRPSRIRVRVPCRTGFCAVALHGHPGTRIETGIGKRAR